MTLNTSPLNQMVGKFFGDTGQNPRDDLHDEEMLLVKRCTNGEESARLELFERYKKDVSQLVARMLGQKENVSEVTLDVFLQVFRTLPDFRGKWSLTTWIYRVAVSRVLRHRKLNRSNSLEADRGSRSSGLATTLGAKGEGTAHVATLERFLGQLSENKRTVFILRELQRLALADIARIVGTPVFVTQTRLYSARRELACPHPIRSEIGGRRATTAKDWVERWKWVSLPCQDCISEAEMLARPRAPR